MNNPIMALIQAARGGGDPMQVIGQMAGGNPVMQMGMQMMRGKNPQQLRQMAENMARQRGVNVEDIINTLGLR